MLPFFEPPLVGSEEMCVCVYVYMYHIQKRLLPVNGSVLFYYMPGCSCVWFQLSFLFLAWSQQSAGVHMMDDNCGIRYDWTLATNCSGVPGQLMTLNSGFSSSAAGLLKKS